jgi:hypothetical protein
MPSYHLNPSKKRCKNVAITLLAKQAFQRFSVSVKYDGYKKVKI